MLKFLIGKVNVDCVVVSIEFCFSYSKIFHLKWQKGWNSFFNLVFRHVVNVFWQICVGNDWKNFEREKQMKVMIQFFDLHLNIWKIYWNKFFWNKYPIYVNLAKVFIKFQLNLRCIPGASIVIVKLLLFKIEMNCQTQWIFKLLLLLSHLNLFEQYSLNPKYVMYLILFVIYSKIVIFNTQN